ncbi:lipocalin-like domain-containing protein [Fulvivirga sediminis]|uniref:Lipocalin-like domain-containing protein n=1 Tax=Fulvivirga sediminis TaxID=2803949 RepID=A0A937JZ21_9BACT|nr:lipocalin-like domain-containing protein [Fulvivirga sediminis]MBL3656244.1 lipocalin-like domain-containing protein [Fulvivirga sediminis]
MTEKIIGTWKLESWYYEDENGQKIDYFGKSPEGILIYDKVGYMSVHIIKHDRQLFKLNGMYEGTSEELNSAFKSYFGYYGRYYSDETGTLTHVVEGSAFPNWKGNVEKRYARIEENKLIIYTQPIETEKGKIIFFIVWERCKK